MGCGGRVAGPDMRTGNCTHEPTPPASNGFEARLRAAAGDVKQARATARLAAPIQIGGLALDSLARMDSSEMMI